jgi:hypothetical protein
MRGGIVYDVPSTMETILYFLMDIVIFGLLAWYFDHVDSSNRGKTYSKLFFLEKDYWFSSNKKKINEVDYKETVRETKQQLDELNVRTSQPNGQQTINTTCNCSINS